MKLTVYAIGGLFVVALIFQIWNLGGENRRLGAELETLASEAKTLSAENSELQGDIEYYAEPENLGKELKSRFDYKRPGEELIKIQ